MADYTLEARVTADTGDFTSGMAKAEDALDGLKSKADETDRSTKKAGGGVSGFSAKCSALSGAVMGVAGNIAGSLFNAVASLGGEMVSAADSTQKFASTLDFAGIDTATIDALTKSTQAYADQTVYGLEDIRNVTAQLAANGVDNYAQLAEAAGNLNAVAGGNASTFQSVGQVMTQTAGAGKLMTENWNQLTDAIPGASGALQQAMKDAGAFEGNFREAMENGEISADEFFAAVQKLGLQDVAREAATSTSTIEGALGNLQASVVGLGSQAISALTPMITGGMNQITSFVSSVPGTLAPVGQAIMSALSGGGTEGVSASIGALMANVLTSVTEGIAQLTAQLPATIQTAMPVVLAALTAGLTALATNLPGIIMGLLTFVVTGITQLVGSVGQQLPTLLAQLVPALFAGLSDLMSQLVANFPSYLGMIVSAAISLFMGIAQSLPQVVPDVLAGLAGLIGQAIASIPTFLGAIVSAALALFVGVATGALQSLPDLLSSVGDLLQGAWDAITSFDLADAGVQLIQGFINGVTSMAGALWDSVTGIVGNAIDGAKSLLGIASPSKVFAEIGDYTMQGFAKGIASEAKAVARGMRDAIGGAVDGARAEVGRMSIGMPDFSAWSAEPQRSRSPEAAASIGPSTVYYIGDTNVTTMDDRSFAESFIRLMTDSGRLART